MLWQGGEPTLRGLGFFERLVELCERYRRPTQRVRHTLQTNGTLVSDEWARFSLTTSFSWEFPSTDPPTCTTLTG